MMALRWLALLVWLGGIGCSSVDQVWTASPQPAPALVPDTTQVRLQSRIRAIMEVDALPLPEGIQHIRFRVTEVHLKATEGGWKTYPAVRHLFDIQADKSLDGVLLTTEVPVAAYDSLALSLEDIFIQYSPHAGGPLLLESEGPLRLPLGAYVVEGRSVTLRLRFDPQSSLMRDDQCRWHFNPVFRLMIE